MFASCSWWRDCRVFEPRPKVSAYVLPWPGGGLARVMSYGVCVVRSGVAAAGAVAAGAVAAGFAAQVPPNVARASSHAAWVAYAQCAGRSAGVRHHESAADAMPGTSAARNRRPRIIESLRKREDARPARAAGGRRGRHRSTGRRRGFVRRSTERGRADEPPRRQPSAGVPPERRSILTAMDMRLAIVLLFGIHAAAAVATDAGGVAGLPPRGMTPVPADEGRCGGREDMSAICREWALVA